MRSFPNRSPTPQNAALELEKTQLKEMLREKVPDIVVKVENNLVDKYCYLEYTNVFNRNRTRALKVHVDVLATHCGCRDSMYRR